MRKKYIIAFSCAAIIFAVLLVLLSWLTEPKYINESREGNLIAEYYREADVGNRHDVIFIGDCEVYSAFVPPILYEEYGIRSFVRGSPSQSIVQSYCLLKETLRYEKPRAVVLSVYALCKTEPSREAYNRMTLDGMRLSWEKIGAVFDIAGESESGLSYLFPLLRFHSRIYSLEAEDLEYLLSRPRVSHNGYFMEKGIASAERKDYEDTADTPSPLPSENLATLEKIAEVCQKNGVELILVKAPISSWRYPWHSEWDLTISDYAAQNGIAYYNLIEESDCIGIDMTTDTYDGGYHLNIYGAEKTSRYFGGILKENHGISGCKSEIWEEKLQEYYKERSNEEN